MPRPVRVLIFEASQASAYELDASALSCTEFSPEHRVVRSEHELRAALTELPWEVVILSEPSHVSSDRSLLAAVHTFDPDLPVIVVSAPVDVETAVGFMREGAEDYVATTDLGRLPVAIQGALAAGELRRDKRRLERARRFLSAAGALLGESLDSDVTLEELAKLSVQGLADWCVIDLVDKAGELRRVAAADADPGKDEWVAKLKQLPPARMAERGPAAVAKSGVPELVTRPQDQAKLSGGDDETYARVVRELGLRSYMCVPLRARMTVLGVITFVSANPARTYGEPELELAVDLARRAAIALDNARLLARAEEAIRLRDEFLTVASHELKTPLTALQLQVQSLHQGLCKGEFGTVDERIQHKLDRVLRATERLSRLVESLLDVSRIASGRLRLAPENSDFTQLLYTVVDRFRGLAEAAGSDIELSAPPQLLGRWDKTRIEQLLVSLISNAIKYGQGRPIAISLANAADGVVLSVTDRGIGISERDLQRIFGRFERSGSLLHFGGLGLGLYISRKIADAHGGEIDVSSAPGQQTTFTVRLPLQTYVNTSGEQSAIDEGHALSEGKLRRE